MKLTVIIPCYNEEKTIAKLLQKILSLKKIKLEIIIVNDGSTDNSVSKIKPFLKKKNIFLLSKKNEGKGSAIIAAKKKITGNIVIIQDADLEYDPKDFHKLIKPIIDKKYKIVYGSRTLNKNIFEKLNNFSHWLRILGNIFLTKLSNIVNNQNLTDAHTCYKVFDAKLFKSIVLKEKNFNFCPEITTKVSNLGYKIKEVEINYNGRNYSDGKKISSYDGLRAVQTLIKYKFFK